MKKVFIINGVARAGKDSFVDFFGNFCSDYILNISTIDPIKQAMDELGIPNEKTDKYRKFASDLKDMCTREYNVSFNYIIQYLDDDKEIYNYCFVHCREPEEIDKLKNTINNELKIKCETILIIRENFELIPNNHADQNVLNYDYDHIISACLLDELKEKAIKFYKEQENV